MPRKQGPLNEQDLCTLYFTETGVACPGPPGAALDDELELKEVDIHTKP